MHFHILNMGIRNIRLIAMFTDFSTSSDSSVDKRLTAPEFWTYNPLTSKEVGFGSPLEFAAKSRNCTVCGFFIGTSYGGADGRAQALPVFAPRVPRSSNLSALPPDLEVGRQSFNGTLETIMAQLITAGTAALIASDLQINVVPRAYTRYQGTAAQLIAEGLIPKDFKWPTGDERVTVKVGRFEHWIFRTRPEGHKGPKSSWTSGDCWFLRRELANQPRDGWRAADIYAKKMELAKTIYLGSSEWSCVWDKAYKAKQDDKYMAFRTLLLGELAPRKRGRPAKSSTTEQSQGASA
jgi:hypothetical protein